jgi:hypothetical protein
MLAKYLPLFLGIMLVVASAFSLSSFLAILGVATLFFGIILIYLAPVKHVPLSLLNAASISSVSNTERILIEMDLKEKGRYLPPSLLPDFDSSIVFIPEYSTQSSPKPEEVEIRKLSLTNQRSIFITPPGLALSKLLEKAMGFSFTKTDLNFVVQKFSKLIVEDLELAIAANLHVQNNSVILELNGSVLQEICQETKKLPKTHSQVGCLFSSAVACVLAKASGKVVTIEKDELGKESKITVMEFKLWDV